MGITASGFMQTGWENCKRHSGIEPKCVKMYPSQAGLDKIIGWPMPPPGTGRSDLCDKLPWTCPGSQPRLLKLAEQYGTKHSSLSPQCGFRADNNPCCRSKKPKEKGANSEP
eukprot:1159432-Pelagomonas_calceolata.AAC.2